MALEESWELPAVAIDRIASRLAERREQLRRVRWIAALLLLLTVGAAALRLVTT